GDNFKIQGSAVGDSVTAANLNAVTNGGNADSQHTHAAGLSIAATLPATPLSGELLCATTTASTLARANAAASATGKVVGTFDGVSSRFRGGYGDVRPVRFVGSLSLSNGDLVFASATAGQATNVDPTIADTTRTRHILGTIWDSTGYNGTS